MSYVLERQTVCCNLWDNIFSNLQSPLNSIPEEFKLELFNSNSNNYKSGEIWVSVSQNKIKFIIYENLKIENHLENMVDTLISDLIGKNENVNTNSNNMDEIISVVFDFNKNSSISLFTENLCQSQNVPNLNILSVKFFLVSYDLLTYYQEKPMHYDYTFADAPLKYNLKPEEEKKRQLELAYSLLGIEEKDPTKSKDIDQNALVIFRVNKETNELTEINIKYNNLEIFNFRTKLTKFSHKEGQKIHSSVFANKESRTNSCSLLDTAIDNKTNIMNTVIQIIIKHFISTNN